MTDEIAPYLLTLRESLLLKNNKNIILISVKAIATFLKERHRDIAKGREGNEAGIPS